MNKCYSAFCQPAWRFFEEIFAGMVTSMYYVVEKLLNAHCIMAVPKWRGGAQRGNEAGAAKWLHRRPDNIFVALTGNDDRKLVA